MRVRRLVLDNFMRYASLNRAFPPRGVVLVLGPNGSGKSTIVEGVAWALHGETVRGSRAGGRALVEVESGGKVVTVERQRGGGTQRLLLTEGDGAAGGVTATETQGKIDAILGRWERWAATSVFSREVMVRFGLATDKERKALLEQLLGLERFNLAAAAATAEVRAREKVLAALSGEAARLEGELSGLRAAEDLPLADLEGRAAGLRSRLSAAESDAAAAAGVLADARARVEVANSEMLAANSALARARARSEDAKARRANLVLRMQSSSKIRECPVCLRAVSDGDRASLRTHYEAEVGALDAEVAAARREEALLAGDYSDASAALGEAQENMRSVQGGSSTSKELATSLRMEVRGLEERIEKARGLRGRLDAAEAAVSAKAGEIQVADAGLLVARSCAEVFGLQGARNALLGRALARLERATNAVLDQLGMGIRIRVRGSTVQKNQREVDKVSIGVEGAGGGDYAGASSGERARIDVAFLLGLASLSADRGGIVFFDEVFDALDAEGVERVAALLSGMGAERQVVVITHNEDLAALFPQSTVWRVRDGAVS